MQFREAKLGSFMVIGISVRTTNRDGRSQEDIAALWGRFMSENVASKIPGKANDKLYCIYTDYESNFMGAYTTILGYEVNSAKNLPEGLVAITIPAFAYRVYQSNGPLPGSVVNTWKHIWEIEIPRKYLADFDIYPPDAFHSSSPIVETYVSV